MVLIQFQISRVCVSGDHVLVSINGIIQDTTVTLTIQVMVILHFDGKTTSGDILVLELLTGAKNFCYCK